MINKDIRNYISEQHSKVTLFENPSYDNSILGMTEDGRVVYSYDSMITELSKDENLSVTESIEFINYNTLRCLPYMKEEERPIIVFDTLNIKEYKND